MSELDAPDDERLVVAVVRTGGIAGVRRQWQVEPPCEEVPRWIELIERCPWGEPPQAEAGADRFVWRIHARTGAADRASDVPESQLSGPWRHLVDAVREAAATEDDPAPRG